MAREIRAAAHQPRIPAIAEAARHLGDACSSRQALPPDNLRCWYDLSGIVVIRETARPRARVSVGVELPDDRNVHVYLRRRGRTC
ncbi:MAG: hypothetical protein U5K36_04860 [Roseovarius sp.]|nr:hypothetical protein [Roseovarius sp.]